jgi:hypothetical protein
MPEFVSSHVDHGTFREPYQDHANGIPVSRFCADYLECVEFTDGERWKDYDDEGNLTIGFREVEGFAPLTIAQAQADCDKFEEENAADLAVFSETFNRDNAAHDLWYSRNGHGTGFWDADITNLSPWGSRPAAEALKARLDAAAKNFGTLETYVGDDGLVYFFAWKGTLP